MGQIGEKRPLTMRPVFHSTQVNGNYVTLTSLETLAFVVALCSTARICCTDVGAESYATPNIPDNNGDGELLCGRNCGRSEGGSGRV